MPHRPPSFLAAFEGLWRLTWSSRTALPKLPGIAAILLLAPFLAWFLESVAGGGERNFHGTLLYFHFQVFLPLICLLNFGNMIREELSEDTFVFVISRPVSRARYYLIKFIALGIWIEGLLLINGLLMLVVGRWIGIEEAGSQMAHYIWVQAAGVLAYGALAALFGLITRKFALLGIIYGLVVEFGIARLPTDLNAISIRRHLMELLSSRDAFQRILDFDHSGHLIPLGALAIITAALLLAGCLIITLREYSHAEEMHKD